MSEKRNVLWEVQWSDGHREVIEARNLQQSGFGGFLTGGGKEQWVLYAEGRGVVLVADKNLIASIRCLDPSGEIA